MGFRVFGAAEVLSVHTGANQAATAVRKQAHRAVFSYVPRDEMVYVRSRAISSRCNDNFDFFGAKEIEQAYRTFIGKPVFVNHHNSDHRQARGVVIDAALHRDRNPDGSPDTWVEVLMEVDGRTYPKLALALIKGDIDRTSMGCDVQISKCSVCGNEAKNPHEYCRHIPAMKGKKIYAVGPAGQRTAKLVYEECFGLSFFENSLLVEPPADPTALTLGKIDVGAGLEHMLPSGTPTDLTYQGGADTETHGNRLVRQVAASRVSFAKRDSICERADRLYGVLVEDGMGVGATSKTASSLSHVGGVHGVSPQDPVSRVVAQRGVAGVPNYLAFGDRPNQGFVPPPVGPDGRPALVIEGQPPVPVVEHASGPRPTGLRTTAAVDIGQVPLHHGGCASEATRISRPADHDDYFIAPLDVARQALYRFAAESSDFLNNYPPDHEIDQDRRGRRPGEQQPWKPYRHELEARPEPRVAHPVQIAQATSSREHGTTYQRVPPGTKGAFNQSSPEDEYHGPYEVIKHPDTGKYHVVDNQDRVTGYGGRKGMDDRFQAEHARDYNDYRQGVKEHARGMAQKMWSGFTDIVDPGGTDESRESERNTRAMNNLQNLGYEPHHIKFDDEDGGRPHAEIEHTLPNGRKSGWYGHDHGGSGYLEIKHRATGESHDAVYLGRDDDQAGRIPGYGPAEAQQDLRAWHDDHETGAREHYEQNDPRIRRWQQRRQGARRQAARYTQPVSGSAERLKTGPAGRSIWPVQAYAHDRRTGAEAGAVLDSALCEHHIGHLKGQIDDHNANATGHPHTYSLMHDTWPVDPTDPHSSPCAACVNRSIDSAFSSMSKRSAAAEKKPSKADQFFHDNPVDPQHLVHMFKQATDAQRTEGMDWYKHMHRTARMITGGHVDKKKHDVVGGDPGLGAGLLANYSQQSSLSDNHWKASKTAMAGQGLWSGNHPGMFAGQEQAHKADRMLSGEHYSTVLGAPKTRNFAHLIEHGGNDGSGRTAVCVDRHAVSAAIGRRVSDARGNDEFGTANLSATPSAADKKAGHTENHRYRMVADAYRHAASQLSKETGQHIEPHHVQAVTWVMQRDQNDEAERKETDPNKQKLIKGRLTKNKNETARWHAHVAESYPEFAGQEHWKMTSLNPRYAYNETKAPMDVDTLRNESCDICGNDLAFDGRECQVCGYVAPPKALDDPDVDKAKQLDQLKQQVGDQLDEADPSRPGADFEAGDLDQLDPGGDNSANPWLACTNCGTEMRPTAPQTTGGGPDDGQEAPAGPAAGDPCPVCQQGELAPTGESEDNTDADAEVEAEDEEDQDGEGAPQGAATVSDKGSGQAPPGDDEGEEDDAEDGDEDSDDDDAQDPDQKKPRKNPAGKATAAMKYRDHSKESRMNNNALRYMAAQQRAAEDQQRLIDHQQHTIASLHQRMGAKDSQIQRLSAGLTVIARHLGVEVETMVRSAMLHKRADEQNPAQPIPEPAPQPPTQSTPEAETPEAFADVRMPGMVPGVNNDVAADAVTTAYTPGQDIGTPPTRQLVDVTAPVAGTQGPRPTSEVKTDVDVRAGNPMNPQPAFPLNQPFSNAQRTGSQAPQDDIRTFSSMRLARLQIASGIAQGDDLTIGQRIASNPAYSMERINQEINTLNQVRSVAAQSQQGQQYAMPPRGIVPRSASAAPAQRMVPPLATTASMSGYGGGISQEDADLAAALI